MNVKKIIESLLLVSEKPLTLTQINEVIEGAELKAIKSAIKSLKEEYSNPEHGFQIAEVAGGYQFCTSPDCSQFLKKLYTTRSVFRLSAPALETLAIIAYKQPVTRSEIEFIRGVNVEGVLKTLLDRMLVKIEGRKEVVGRPIMYGTTVEFLQYFGLKSLEELPSLEEFTRQGSEPKLSDKSISEGGQTNDEEDEHSEVAQGN